MVAAFGKIILLDRVKILEVMEDQELRKRSATVAEDLNA
jgi:hypothetical protein